MTLVGLAVRNVRRNMFRNSLTIIGVAVAMLAFMLLRTVLSAWTVGAEFASKDRIGTRHKVTFVMPLPKRYVDDVRGVQGITAATWMNWFGGRLAGREDAFFANMATDPKTFLTVYDEIKLPDAERDRWFENRQGAIIGVTLAKQFGWKVGDHVTLAGTIYPGDWELQIEGIYTATRKSIDQSSLFFHWDYLNDRAPERMKEHIGWIMSRIDNPGAAATIAKRVDDMFDIRDTQTLSMSERALNSSFLGMLSTVLKAVDLVSIVILAIMMLILGNTIAMAVRERTREYGALRAMGFMPRHIATFVVGEAATLGLMGGVLGVLVSLSLIDQGISRFVEENFSMLFPYFRVATSDAVMALGVSALLSGLAAALPAYQASRLKVTDALRKVG
jgi:putative ABC transport system permease protein